ncbi:uncharacterized protein LOC123475741 [Daphnia magna]|uniref:uncharacterized protein LOC123475741 n=1 Tax=Daphnia magna TaxID=35525 RepID=UPI001E1BC90A|nr:uncharacterized protein LOC123475741 [Daphnia magna]
MVKTYLSEFLMQNTYIVCSARTLRCVISQRIFNNKLVRLTFRYRIATSYQIMVDIIRSFISGFFQTVTPKMVYANLIGTQDRNMIYRTSHPNCIAIAISIIGFIFWKCHKKRMPSSRKQVEVSVEECPICLEPYVDKYWLSCCHTFCYKCLVKWTRIKLQCPMCRHPITDSIPWIKDSPSDEISDYEPDPNVDAEDDEVVILAEQQPDDNWVLYLDDEAIEMPMPISGSRVFVEVLMNTDEFHLALLDGIGRIVGEHLDISRSDYEILFLSNIDLRV